MDEQALQGLGPMADSASHARALAYFEQLKQSDEGWKLCAEAVVQGMYESDHIKFFCFQVLENFLKTRYPTAIPSDQQILKQSLLQWLQMQTLSTREEKSFIRNKVAQLYSLLFINDFPHRWLGFFRDLIQLMHTGPSAVDMYLRILIAIDEDVVDRDLLQTQEDAQRSTVLKDSMREHSLTDMVSSWYQILKMYENSNPELTCLCLEVIGAYVSWIDINLIANDRFVSLLLRYLSVDVLRESACDCFHEIISKGMDPVAKTELVESITKVLHESGVIPPSDDDVDFLAKLSKLTNGIGVNLIASWEKLRKTRDSALTAKTLQAIESKLPLLFEFLGHEDDDISLAVTGFAHDYIGVLKQISKPSQEQLRYVENMLCVVIRKFKYEETYNFDSQGEDEIMFIDYRRQMKILFDNLTQLNQALVLQVVHSFITNTLSHWKSVKFTETELAVRLMYMLGEAVPATQGNHFVGDQTRAEIMRDLMRLLVTSRVVEHSHWAVGLQVFETIARYDKFFNCEPQHIPNILMAFLGDRGLRHCHPTIRSRTAYLFSRFIKALKHHLTGFSEDILKRIQDLLVIAPPENGHQLLLTSDDQLFIYEAAGTIISSSSYGPEKKEYLMKNLLAPTIDKFNTMFDKMCMEKDEQKRQKYAEVAAQSIAFASRTSKAFYTQLTMKQSGCEGCFIEALRVFLRALDTPYHHQILHSVVRQYLHRMIICLEESLLPYVPMAVEHLLKKSEARDIHEFIPLINQIASKFKRTIVPFMRSVFMPIVTTIFSVLGQPADELDIQAKQDKDLLKRSYFQFLQTLVANDVSEVISSQDAENFKQVLLTIIQGAVESQDPIVQKTAFAILRKLVDKWAGKDGLPGFRDFIYKYIVPACFMAPLKATFNLSDGQTVLALNEDAAVLKSVLAKEGSQLISFLQQDYFPSLPLGPEPAQAFCRALQEMELKMFRNYSKVFFESARKS
ncbi:exportin-T-like [Patiria miniata]|uniref:Exportin-T n=1 Tax=Patiria miniata TaxID=46514 RepID=A0A913ZSQ3_PATMI|nr:exportin-T-like [Patiria miniata]XP_038054111.1 exportin-T-like [Patiria miniata]